MGGQVTWMFPKAPEYFSSCYSPFLHCHSDHNDASVENYRQEDVRAHHATKIPRDLSLSLFFPPYSFNRPKVSILDTCQLSVLNRNWPQCIWEIALYNMFR